LGIYGGSFDPIHLGHLLVAEATREALALARVLFVPARVSPLKPHGPVAGAEHRARMVALAIEGNPHFALSRVDLDREGPSYSVDTVARIRDEAPDADLYFLVGMDALPDLPRWRDPERLLALCRLAAFGRPDAPPLDRAAIEAALPGSAARIEAVQVPAIAISSTDLRQRLREGRSVRYRVLPTVEAYLHAHHLYQ
jgi:nicotinate-nucleotide adenylyltransferase